MTWLLVVLWVVAVASILAAAYFATRLIRASAENAVEHVATTFERRLVEQDALEEQRRVALYKQRKATNRMVAKRDEAVRRMADDTQALRDEVLSTRQHTERMLKRVEGGG